MASTNQSPQYQKAEAQFLSAKTDSERLVFLEEMIRLCPRHKSSEKMLANLRTRHIKLKEKIERIKKTRGGGRKEGIKKEGVQVVIVGKTNSGKSSLLKLLTQAKPEITSYHFTTKNPVVGMMIHEGLEFQLIENPAFESEHYDRGLAHTADVIMLLVNSLEEVPYLKKELDREKGKQIVVFNERNLSESEKRKISATLESKRHNYVIVNLKFPKGAGGGEDKAGLEKLKEKLLQSSGRIRIFTKEPGKEPGKKPVILLPESAVKDVAEKILKGFSSRVKETKIWGPSSKFAGQIVGLKHKLKDLDVVEFKTR